MKRKQTAPSAKARDKATLTFRHALWLATAAASFVLPFAVWLAWQPQARVGKALLLVLSVFCVVLGGALGKLTAQDRSLLWAAEWAFKLDLDNDGHLGKPPEPEPEPEPPIIWAHDGGKRQKQQERTRDFHYFLRGAYGPVGTTFDAWDGQRLPSGQSVSQEMWEKWCKMLLDAELAERPYPTSTLQFTSDYLDAVRVFSDLGDL